LIPAFIVRFVLKERLRDYGWTLRGLGRMWPWLIAVFIPMAIVVLWASSQPTFQAAYPFYRSPSSLSYLLIWELSYALQFVALEFFFRGFMIHGLKRRYGTGALWLMVIPYCMIHFPKPAPEAIGSIAAGLFLGVISLRMGTIFAGVVLHVAIAWSMDVMSLWKMGDLSRLF
jgi:membrane protease YdiL (CAAX protease family)